MGGGAAMRAAAKVAGINATIRGIPGVSPADNPFARPISTFFSNPDASLSVKTPYWEMDDWEFAGGDEELMADPKKKLLFGGAPTLKEAEEATLELKEAVNKAYLLPNTTTTTTIGCSTEDMETIGCITNVNTAPKQAIQAFHFLNENTAVQSVVASIASDPNVWNAVLQNEALMAFLQSQKSNTAMKSSGNLSDAESKYESKKSDEMCTSEDRNVIEDIVENMRVRVVEMMNSLSGYFQNVFGGTVAADGSEIPAADKAMSASFMGLAVMVIMVVVLDREGGVGISRY